MSLSADQLSAFRINGGFVPGAVATLLLGTLFAVLLVWSMWSIRSAYYGWASRQLSHKEFVVVIIRFSLMYLALSFLLLS